MGKIDCLTVDAAVSGTGMSRRRMMNEWGVLGIGVWSLLHRYCNCLAKKGEYVPDIVLAGGFVLEDQMLKGLASCAPYVKAIGTVRAPRAAVMVGKAIGETMESGQLPVYLRRCGRTREAVAVAAEELRREYGRDYEKIPTSATRLYTHYERLAQGLRQLICGARKFALEYITRNDIAALTPEAAKLSHIPLDVHR